MNTQSSSRFELARLGAPLARFDQLTAFVPPLLARLTVGFAFIHSGWAKLHHLDKVQAFFESLGIPAPGFHSVFVSSIELGCGSLVILGLLTRLAAVPLMGTMVVAIVTAKLGDVGDVNDLVGLIEVTYLVLLAYLAHAGGGQASVDRLLFGRKSRALPKGLFPAEPSRISEMTAATRALAE